MHTTIEAQRAQKCISTNGWENLRVIKLYIYVYVFDKTYKSRDINIHSQDCASIYFFKTIKTFSNNLFTHFGRSVVKSINGTKVGIIGFITQSTSYNFPNSTIAFTDEISSIQVVN